MNSCTTCTKSKCLPRKYAYKALKELLADPVVRETIIHSDYDKGIFYKLRDLDTVLALDCLNYLTIKEVIKVTENEKAIFINCLIALLNTDKEKISKETREMADNKLKELIK